MKVEERNIVLLFDEAQHLIEIKGELYKALQWWLRIKREKINIVAVFAGATCSPNDVMFLNPMEGPLYHPNEEYVNLSAIEKINHEPFFEMTTTALGCKLNQQNSARLKEVTETNDFLYDIRKHGYFGRPLFAEMMKVQDNKIEPYLIAVFMP